MKVTCEQDQIFVNNYEVSSSLRKISTCVDITLPNVCVKCTRKPLVCLYLKNQTLVFLVNLILVKGWYEDVAIRFLEGWEQIRKIRSKLLHTTLNCCYICASELCLSLRLGIHFKKSLINILQLVDCFMTIQSEFIIIV